MYYREKKIVFVHIPKTAGQSVEHFFLRDAGLTWETREAFIMGPPKEPGRGPKRLAHLLARDYVGFDYLTQQEFDEAYKFAFVRHPMARALSCYKYERAFQRMSFHDYANVFLRNRIAGENNWFHRPQVDFVNDLNGKPLLDFIGRFENLEGDFAKVCAHLEMPFETLPEVNVSLVSDRQNRQKHTGLHERFRNRMRSIKRRLRNQAPPVEYPVPKFDDALAHRETVDAIQELYAADYEQFGYDKT